MAPAAPSASQYVHPEVVKLLLEKGADVNAKSHYEGYEITPVIHAIKSRHLSVVELLLEQEDISITDDEHNMVVDQEHLDETDPRSEQMETLWYFLCDRRTIPPIQ